MQQKKKRSWKRKSTLLALFLVFAVAVGTSLAIFTDSFSFNEDFTAGTLKLVNGTGIDACALVGVNGLSTTPADATNMAPGDVFNLTGKITNSGTLDAKIQVALERTDGGTNGTWSTVDTSAVPATIAAGATLDLSTLATPLSITYALGDSIAVNDNDEQGQTYTYKFVVEAMQDRNTTGSTADWTLAFPVAP